MTHLLVLCADAQLVEVLEDSEEAGHVEGHPGEDHNDAQDLAGQQVAAAAVEQAPVRLGAVHLRARGIELN